MLRTTKKNAPRTTTVYVLLSNFEEYDSTMQKMKSARGKEDIFSNLIPSPEKQGHVYIGFPTHQTCGSGVSFAGHFIPTVERESIDFADKHLAVWNVELVSVFGLVNRICYENEMTGMDKLLQNMELDSTSTIWFYQKVSFLAKLFMPKDSTPSPLIGNLAYSNFHSCCKIPFKMISSTGKLVSVMLLRQSPSDEMKVFIKSIPYIPPQLEELCPDVIKHYKRLGLLTPISLDDVISELGRPLEKGEMIALLSWWVKQVKEKKVFRPDVEKLRRVLRLDLGGGKSFHLGGISRFNYQPFTSKDLPLPDYCLSSEFCKGLTEKEIESCFWDWKELSGLEWITFIVNDPNFQTSVEFTEKAMGALSRLYCSNSKISASDKVTVLSLLENLKCISTESHGLQTARACYFPSVSLFEDLPKIKPKICSDVLLKDLGVREHVNLQIIFDRLADLKWDQQKLVKYLSSIQEKLKPNEIKSLSTSSIFLKENGAENERYRANQLFPPLEKFRNFGLPLILWPPGKWKFTSPESSLMRKLGLNSIIQLSQLIEMIASSKSMKEKLELLNFFAAEHEYEVAYNPKSISTPFISLEDSTKLSLPSGCFSDDRCGLMGFPVCQKLMKPFASKLGIREAPTGDELIERLRSNPPTIKSSEKVFEFCHSISNSFSSKDWLSLKQLKFIPVETQGKVSYHSPNTVYLKNDNMISHFKYINYSSSATLFLKACGCNEHPSPTELAERLATSPESFLENESKYSLYLDLLRQIAANYRQIRNDKRIFNILKSSEFLIALKAHDEEGKEKAFALKMAKDIYLVDDPVLAQVFKPFTAPIEPAIEAMYVDLGSTWISANVQEKYSVKGDAVKHDTSLKLQEIIRERAILLLYDGHQMRKLDEIASNSQQLLERIDVSSVPKIEIVRTFGNAIKAQETTACLSESKQIHITTKFDYFDVASAVAKLILKAPRLNDCLLISTFLSSTLENLTRKGFPVERILAANHVKQTAFKTPTLEQTPSRSITSQSNSNSNLSSIKPPKEDAFSGFLKQIGQTIGISSKPSAPNEPSSKKALENSISNVNPANDSRIISSVNLVSPKIPMVAKSCHEVKDLMFVQQLSRNLKLFCANGYIKDAPFDTDALGIFANLIETLAIKVFGISSAVNIFWDPLGAAIAFNRDKQLFFNFRHFLKWHKDLKSSMDYWFIIFCHELAHNEHGPHDEIHEYWLSSFASTYMEKLFLIRNL
jgi:hypothetical protein